MSDCTHDKRFHLMGAHNGCCACEVERLRANEHTCPKCGEHCIECHCMREEIERLREEVNRLHTECGHLHADKEELTHELFRCRQLLSTAVDAWECGQMVRDKDGVVVATFRAAMLPQAWCGAARAAGGEGAP